MGSKGSVHGIVGLRVGVCAGWFYHSEEDFCNGLLAFVREGIRHEHSVLFISPDSKITALLGILKREGIRSEYLTCVSLEDFRNASGPFDTESVLQRLQKERAQAFSEGRKGLSVLFDMSWMRGDSYEPAYGWEFSVQLRSFLLEGRSLVFGTFDRSVFSPTDLLAVLPLFPQIVLEGRVYSNRYYSPSDGQFKAGEQGAPLLDLLVGRIKGVIKQPDLQWEVLDSGDTLLMLQEIIDSMGEGVAVVDEEGRMLLFNRSAELMCGLGKTHLPIAKRIRAIGNFLADKVTPFPLNEVPIVRALNGESTDHVRLFLRNEARPQGVMVSVSARPIRDGKGTIKGAVSVFRDITSQEEAAEKQSRLEARMCQNQRLEGLGLLAEGIAHDFNNLLMGVLGNASLALLEAPEGTEMYGRVEQIKVGIQRLAELTNQLLAYSGRASATQEPVNLSALVGEMQNLLRTVVSKKAEVFTEFAKDLPIVRADPTHVRQIVMNLITNASEALDGRPGKICIRTEKIEVDRDYLLHTYLGDEHKEGEYVCVEVSDTGCGMDTETQARIFDPFFTTKRHGRGLGLATVLGLVRRHGGALGVRSTPGEGTRFRVLFPSATGVAVEESPEVASERDFHAHGTVLVVDDEEVVRSVTKDILEFIGFSVLTAENGEQGILKFKEHAQEIVLVLLDMTMPDISGEEVFYDLKEHRADVPIILSSGYSKSRRIERLMQDGLDGYMQKPYVPEALITQIRSVMTGSKSHGFAVEKSADPPKTKDLLQLATPEKQEARSPQVKDG